TLTLMTVEESVQVRRKNVKIVLLGESGVGKSTLAERFASNDFVSRGDPQGMETTHGMKVLRIDASIRNERREIFLWDLGGQEWYRLVHQLFLGRARVAIFLFDGSRDKTGLEEVRIWNSYLSRQSPETLTKILVRNKIDQQAFIQNADIEALQKE